MQIIYLGLNILAIWFICPESHIWMLLHEKENEAFESLKQLRGDTKVATLEFRQFKENHQKANAIKSLEEHNGKLLYRVRWEKHFKNYRYKKLIQGLRKMIPDAINSDHCGEMERFVDLS